MTIHRLYEHPRVQAFTQKLNPFLVSLVSKPLIPLELACLLLAPVAAVGLFKISLINQDGCLDPWLYTGYGQNFRLLQAMFGWTYYAVRFPVMFLNQVFPGSMDPVAGYVLLRYLLLLGCGAPLYLWSRRRFGVPVAALSYLFLLANPLLPRVLLWDLTTFVSVPMALAGICLWHLELRPLLLSRMLAGFLFCASVASQAFTGTAILAFFLVELCHRLASGRIRALVMFDMLAPCVGASICFALGMLFYYVEVGPFDPTIVFTVTIGAAKAGNAYAILNSATTFDWLVTQYNAYVPYLLVLVAAVGLGRALLSGSSEARVAWFGLLYSAAYAVYQFVFHGFVLDEFVYFAHLTIVAYLLFPLCLGLIVNGLSPAPKICVLALAAGLLVLFPLLNRSAPLLIDTAQAWMSGSAPAAASIGLVALVCAVLLRLPRRAALASAAAVILVGVVQLVCFVSPSHRSIFVNPYESREFGVYHAAVQMLKSYSALAKPDAKIILWYPNDEASLLSIASAALLFTLQAPFQPHAGEPKIGAYERSRLQIPGLRYVMMLSMSPAELEDRLNALQEAGVAVREVSRKEIGDGVFHTDLEIVELLGTRSAGIDK
jgi:hypothetical protein